MPANSTHPQYDKYISRWETVRDVIESDAGKYIKDVDPSDKRRNTRYRDDAILTNFTARTKNGLVGAIFRKEIEVELPAEIEYLIEDATGTGTTLNKLAQEITGEVLTTGRYGLLVDYPASEEGLTQADISRLNLAARIQRYTAESIINWNTEVVNGVPKLTLVVLKEYNKELSEDGFQWQKKCYYRALMLEEGTYIQALYDENSDLVRVYEPRDAKGSTWDHIPFVFVGAEDNDEKVDASPLYDLAMLNIGHYRNSADYEESVHITGQPTLIITTEMSAEEFKAANPGGVIIGARRGHNLGRGGSAQFLQAASNQLADEAMRRKEEQAVMIGARLITPTMANETVDAARMRHSGETSVLDIIATNVQEALIASINFVKKFMMSNPLNDDVELQLNNQFFDSALDPQMIAAQLQLYTNGVVAKSDIRKLLRKHGALGYDRYDEEIEADIDNEIGQDPGFTFGGLNNGN